MSSTSATANLPECEEEIVEYENITVKFNIDDNQVVAQIYPNCMTIGEVKDDLGRKFEVDPKLLSIVQFGRVFTNECRLCEAEENEFGIYELCLMTCDPGEDGKIPKLNLDIYYNKSRLPDFITVHIAAEDALDGVGKDIIVEIQNQVILKPFIGGYKDKRTGIEYHDAYTLTGPKFDQIKRSTHVSRLSQAKEFKRKIVDTMVDECTQSFGEATKLIFVSAATDFVIIPKKYESYAQSERRKNKLAKIILIQRNFRRFLMMRYMKKCAAEYRDIVADRIRVETQIKEMEEKKRLKRENAAKNLPRTKEDFAILYTNVEKWKMAEMKRIASMYSGAPRIAEVNILLDKEIQLINGIERQRTIARKAAKEYQEKQMLKELGKPVKWVGYNDLVIELDLLRTQRVRFLTEILKDIEETRPIPERLKFLEKLKIILADEKDFSQTPEMLDLIEKEKNLLLHTKYCDVQLIRDRFIIIFKELIKFTKEPRPKPETKMCDCCKIVKPTSSFALLTRQTVVDTCQVCFSLKADIKDNTVYKAILRAIQREERKSRSLSSYAFILQEDDIRFIVDTIWHRHSILSKNQDINLLRLPRWIISDDWSPWNCICLTETEARNHRYLKNLKSVYNENMMLEITNRHLLAKNAFKKLQDVENNFVESGQWWEVGVKQKVV